MLPCQLFEKFRSGALQNISQDHFYSKSSAAAFDK